MSDRISTRVLEDAGDVIRDVNLVDVSASETLIAGAHDPTLPVLWRPATGGTDLYEFRVKSRGGSAGGHVRSHQLETLLGRLTRIYPASVLARGATINAATGGTGDTATMARVLTYVLQQWQVQFPWLDWEAIPELSVNTADGLVTPVVEAIALRQDQGSPTSARRWLDEILMLFTGYVLRVNHLGQLQVVAPPAGSPAITLTADQILSVEPAVSFDDIINKATVRSRHWQYEVAHLSNPVTISASIDDPSFLAWADGPGNRDFEHLGTVTTTQGSILVPTPPGLLPGGTMYVDARLDALNRTRDTINDPWDTTSPRNAQLGFFQEIIINSAAAEADETLTVAPLEQPLLSGAVLRLPGLPGIVTTDVALAGATSIPVTALPADIPAGTSIPHSRIALEADDPNPFTGNNTWVWETGTELDETAAWARLRLNWDGENLRLVWTALRLEGPPDEDLLYQHAFRVALQVIGWNWAQSRTEITATFGKADDAGQVSDLPGFVNSQTEFGVVERTLNAGFINLDPVDALAIAQAYVAGNMAARERVTIEVTPDLPIKPADINKLVAVTPLGANVVIESWEHTEMYDNQSAALTTRVTGVIAQEEQEE